MRQRKCIWAWFDDWHNNDSDVVLARLQQTMIDDKNVFEVQLGVVRVCAPWQITNALFSMEGSIGGVSSSCTVIDVID